MPTHIKPAITEIPAGTVDVFPTLAALMQAKIARPVPLDGVSLLPLLDGKMTARPQPLGFWQFAGDQKNLTSNSGPSAWNDNQYKLQKLGPDHYELYDLTTDISEKSNVATTYPEIVTRMRSELENWQKSVQCSNRSEDYPEKRVIEVKKTATQ